MSKKLFMTRYVACSAQSDIERIMRSIVRSYNLMADEEDMNEIEEHLIRMRRIAYLNLQKIKQANEKTMNYVKPKMYKLSNERVDVKNSLRKNRLEQRNIWKPY